MELSKEPILVRVRRLAKQIAGKNGETQGLLTRDGLLDALQVLYDECTADCLKNNDEKIADFVKKHSKSVRDLQQLRANITDFEVKNVIGRGHFGDVHVVRERLTNDVYALKTVKKSKSSSFAEERDIMATTHSPWHTTLQYAFQNNANLYFVMEYQPGGDLLGLLQRQGGTLPESAACFYIAELVLAINDLHAMGYVHRDVKPDNVLLDRCGHIKLADFGSALKLGPDGTFLGEGLPVGTPEYIAPEVLQVLEGKPSTKNKYGFSCDYWSLGILAYELTVGNTPFHDETTTLTYSKIMNSFKKIEFPADIILSQAFVHLVKGLLKEPHERLSFSTIICHDLFKNTDFSNLQNQVPPFVPNIQDIEDTSNFTDSIKLKEKKDKELNIENYRLKTKFSGKNLPYIGFTFMPDFDLAEKDKNLSVLNELTLKDSVVNSLKTEIEILQKRLLQSEEPSTSSKTDTNKTLSELELLLEEKDKKMVIVEAIRIKLEQDLGNTLTEMNKLKRTLEFEKHERTKLEAKALEMIKSAKDKWEMNEKMRIVEHENELKKQNDINRKLNEKIDELMKEKNFLEMNLNKVNRQSSVDNIKKMARRSVVGLESRLQKVVDDSKVELESLKVCLEKETIEKIDLEKKLEGSIKDNDKLVKKFECLTKKYEDLSKNFETMTADKLCLERRFDECVALNDKLNGDLKISNNAWKNANEKLESFEDLLDMKEKTVLGLEKKIKELQRELNETEESHHNTVKEHVKAWEKKVQEVKNSKTTSLKENNELELKLKECELKNRDYEIKVKALEELLSRLESGVSKLENKSERETVLQEQIDRLEMQLAKIHETTALEHQELLELKSKSWKLEKEHSNALLDRKIAERDVKELKTEKMQLCEQIEELKKKMEKSKELNEEAMLEFEKMNEDLSMEVVKLKENIKQLEESLKFERELMDGEKKKVNEYKNVVVSKDGKIKVLESTIQRLEMDKITSNGKMIEKKEELTIKEKEIEKLRQEINEKNRKIAANDLQLQNIQLNLDALREACTLQENQLLEYERMHEEQKLQIDDNEKKIEDMLNELTKTKFEYKQVKKAENEEKSLKIKAETQRKKLEEEMNDQLNQIKHIEGRYMDLEKYSTSLLCQLESCEEKITNLECDLNCSNRKIEGYLAENNVLKERTSMQITHINNLKELNFNLNEELLCSKSNNAALMDQLNKLENLLEEKLSYYAQREIKLNGTIFQQTKLIDYLQCKLEEASTKKKKTISSILFGTSSSSKKENVPPNFPTPSKFSKAATMTTKQQEEFKAEMSKLKTMQSELSKTEEEKRRFETEFQKTEEIAAALLELSQGSSQPSTSTSQVCSTSTLIGEFNDKQIIIYIAISLNNCTVLGTNRGLFTINNNQKIVKIHGVSSIHHISIVDDEKIVLMIANEQKKLIICDLDHLKSLTECLEVTKPSLKFKFANIQQKNFGFHLLETSNDKRNVVILANKTQLVVAKLVRIEKAHHCDKNIKIVRFIDTCKPISCVLFNNVHSLIIGADKFFEIDLNTLQNEEFLDVSDKNLSHVFKLKSLPLEIFKVSANNLLICYKEFGCFVDEYGRYISNNENDSDLRWPFIPFGFKFVSPYLYVQHLKCIRIYKIAPNLDPEHFSTFNLNFKIPKIIGGNKKGVFIHENNKVLFISAQNFDQDSFISSENLTDSDNDDIDETNATTSDRFSFTSSIVQSLDGNLSDDETKRRVKFNE